MKLASQFCRAGLRISYSQEVLFEKFLEAFVEYNSHTNLSAIREKGDIISKHFADSIMALEFISFAHCNILDIGTGGGMPGIPLAIMLPDSQFTLLDSVGKKIRACNHFADVVGLKNITAVHMRAEDFAHTNRGKFDRIVSRATAFLPTILEWSLPFLAPEGKIVLYKSPSNEEFEAGKEFCKKNRLQLVQSFEYLLEGQERSILVFERLNS